MRLVRLALLSLLVFVSRPAWSQSQSRAAFVAPASASLVWSKLPAGTLTDDVLRSELPSVLWSSTHDRATVQREDDECYLRVRFPSGRWGSDASGAQFLQELPPHLSYRCTYRVRFQENFDFQKGGKLPGLAGGTATTGKTKPNGDGWSARYMWRASGEAVIYLYHMGQSRDQGDDLPLQSVFVPGRWHELTQQIRVNDPGKSNGELRVWFDGRLVLTRTDLQLRRHHLAPVDRFYFSTFFGGASEAWAPTRDCYVDFGNIEFEGGQ